MEEIYIDTIEDFFKLEKPSNMRMFKIKSKCSICGKELHTCYYILNKEKRILCRKHKIEDTLTKNYGSVEAGRKVNTEHGLKTKKENGSLDIWNKRLQETMKQKYGVTNPGQMKDHKEKCEKTLIEHYGSLENARQLSSEKGNATKIQHYGENYGSIIWKKICEQMGVENISQTDIWKKKHLERSCKRISKFANIIQKGDKYFLHCDKCGKDHEQKLNDVWTRCLDCYPIGSKPFSIVENGLKDFLNTYEHFEKVRKIFKNRPKMEIDMYSERLKLGIEVDGIYWHKGFDKNMQLLKYNLAKESGIRLMRIFDDEIIEKRKIVENILKTTLGIYGKKIYARKCEVKEISQNDYIDFVEENHIQGYTPASVKLGLFYENQLVEIMSFARPRYSKHYEWEMMRECSKDDFQIIGGKGKLFAYFVKKYSPNSIVSYCEKRLFTGKSYEKLGFKKEKDSPPAFRVYWNGIVHHRSTFTKANMKNLKGFNFNENMTQLENLRENNAFPIYDCGNFVFSWTKPSEDIVKSTTEFTKAGKLDKGVWV